MVAAVGSVGLAVFGPSLARQAARFTAPMQSMKRKQTALHEMVDKAAWKCPDKDALSAEELERFLQLRQRLDHLLRDSGDPFSGFHGKHDQAWRSSARSRTCSRA